MKIRTMNMEDLDQVMRIYENAREYMIEEGNANQWDKGYPSKEVVRLENNRVCRLFFLFCDL